MADLPLHAGLEHVLAHIIHGFMQSMHHTGLSGPQIHALLYIFHAGECQVSDIAELMGASPPAASQLVERLVQQGLVERAEDPENRRIKRVRLTGKSQRLIRQAVTSNRFLLHLMTSLPAKHRQVVLTAFDYLAQAAQQLHPSNTRKVEHDA